MRVETPSHVTCGCYMFLYVKRRSPLCVCPSGAYEKDLDNIILVVSNIQLILTSSYSYRLIWIHFFFFEFKWHFVRKEFKFFGIFFFPKMNLYISAEINSWSSLLGGKNFVKVIFSSKFQIHEILINPLESHQFKNCLNKKNKTVNSAARNQVKSNSKNNSLDTNARSISL